MIRKYIKQLMPLLVLAVLLSVQLGAASERLPSSVLACWPMDDPIYPHATLTDAGPNQFDLTLWEGELATGRFGGALLVCAEADAYRSDILRSLAMARQHNPLVRLRDGRWVPHYPTHIYRRGRDLGWIRETLEGSVNLLLCGILDPNGPEARGILDDFQDNLYTGGEFGYPIPDFHEPLSVFAIPTRSRLVPCASTVWTTRPSTHPGATWTFPARAAQSRLRLSMRYPRPSKDRNSLPARSEMKHLARNLLVPGVLCQVRTARPLESLVQSSEAASSNFVRLVRLPSPAMPQWESSSKQERTAER